MSVLVWQRKGGIYSAQCGVLHAGIWADNFDWWVGTEPADIDKAEEHAHAHGMASNEIEAKSKAEEAMRTLLVRAARNLGLTLQGTFGDDKP